MNSDQPGLNSPEESGLPVAEPTQPEETTASESEAASENGVDTRRPPSVEALAVEEMLAGVFSIPDETPPSVESEAAESASESEVQAETEFSAETDVIPVAAEADITPSFAEADLTSDSEEPAPEAVADEAPAVAEEPRGPRRPQRGDIIEAAVVIETSVNNIIVDLGNDVRGVIPGRELERMSRKMLESLAPGITVPVYVVNQRDHNGDVVLSVNRAVEEMDWREAEQYRQSQEVYESRVAGYNKGGLIVRFGRVRGFVPQSQLSLDRRRGMSGETPEERWGAMVNEQIAVKVMEVDRGRNRLILSERLASREAREKRKESLVGELAAGEIRTGRVVSLEDFGAFIDIGGAEGLVHLTELSWKHVTHPREMLNVGQEVQVEVISVDRKNKRIGLSMKRLERDPWDAVAIDFEVGQLVRGRVTKLTKFGAFAQLVDIPEVEGLIHISELSDQRVKHPREVVNENDILTLRIVKMDIKDRRLGLSLKRVNSAEYLDEDLNRFASLAGGDEPEEAAATFQDVIPVEPERAASEEIPTLEVEADFSDEEGEDAYADYEDEAPNDDE